MWLHDLLGGAAEDLLRALGGLVIPALAFAVLAFAARGVESVQRTRTAAPDIRTNLALFTLDVIAVTPVLTVLVGLTGLAIQNHGLNLLSPAQWELLPLPLVFLVAIFVGDFVGYWRHRLEHTALLWPAHAIHHSDVAMSWTTGLRFHPINRVTTVLIDSTALALLGFPPEAIAVNAYVRHHYGLFIHLDVPWTFGPLGRVLVSPAMHRWHHIREAEGAGVNFATMSSVFDQAFRTYDVPGPCTVPLGVREPIGRDTVSQLLWPFHVLWRAVWKPAPQST